MSYRACRPAGESGATGATRAAAALLELALATWPALTAAAPAPRSAPAAVASSASSEPSSTPSTSSSTSSSAFSPTSSPSSNRASRAPNASPAPASGAPAGDGARDYSAAETLLFLGHDLAPLSRPARLDYRFRHAGTLDAAFDDPVRIDVASTPQGACCAASGSFLQSPRRMELPPLDDAQANPVVLYVLEHEVREMKRITGGSENYFRKRIRMAIYQDAPVRPVMLNYRGRTVDGTEVRFSPYRDDPNRARFERHVGRRYAFYLSPQVPGGVYGYRAVTPGARAGDPVLAADTLVVDGGDADAVERLAGVPEAP